MLDEQPGGINLVVVDGVVGSAVVEFGEPVAGCRSRNLTGLDRGLEDVGLGGAAHHKVGNHVVLHDRQCCVNYLVHLEQKPYTPVRSPWSTEVSWEVASPFSPVAGGYKLFRKICVGLSSHLHQTLADVLL